MKIMSVLRIVCVFAAFSAVNISESTYNWNIRPISEKMYWVGAPSLHDGQIAWSAEENPLNDLKDVYYWDGTEIHQLTDNPWPDAAASMNNGQIVWRSGFSGEKYTLSFWDGNDTFVVANDPTKKGLPNLWKGNVVYSRELSHANWQVFRWDGENTQQISEEEIYNFYPVQYEDTIMWLGGDESRYHYDIYYYDGWETIIIPAHSQMWRQSLYDGMIAWAEVDDQWEDSDIYIWEDGVKRQITTSPNRDLEPSLFNGMMAYVSNDSPGFNTRGNITFWDGDDFYQVTQGYYDRYPSLYISGNQIQIAWVRYYPDQEWERQVGQIFYATAMIPEPSVIAMVLSGIVFSMSFLKRRKK